MTRVDGIPPTNLGHGTYFEPLRVGDGQELSNQNQTIMIELREAIIFCRDMVRQYDYSSFICSHFLKNPTDKHAAWILRAFNIELSRARFSSTNPQLAKLRLEFWKQSVNNLSASNSHADQPVAMAMRYLITSGQVSSYRANKLISARNNDLDRNGFYYELKEIEEYSEQTVSTVLYAQLALLGGDIKLDHIASHLGKGIGIANFIYSAPTLIKLGFEPGFPASLIAQASLTQEQVLDIEMAKWSQSVAPIVYEMAATAKRHLNTAQLHWKQLDSEQQRVAFAPFMVVIPWERFLSRLEQFQFILDEATCGQDGLVPLVCWWRNWRQKLF